MTAELHNTNVNMEGLLEVLGKNLYSTPNVAIRELVQNAHDACVRRKIEGGGDIDLEIRISVDEKNNQLTILDNGSGLTYDEVLQFLATIGSGYTRLLRNASQTEEMIGYFGLGFLSAYVISSKVDVWTTSYREPEKTWHFSSKGGKQFTINSSTNQPIGTKVKLRVSDQYQELKSLSVLRELLRKYCCLLPIKIYVGNDKTPINDLSAPWIVESNISPLKLKKEQLKFAEIFEDTFKPVCVITIPENKKLKVNGLIWIQDSSGYSTSDYRNVSVFIRNMFITHEGRELLPLWAGFVGCVVDSHCLTPTASREDIQKNQVFEEVKSYLTETLVNGLKHISQNEPENWRRIISRHNQALMGAAINDDVLFDILKDDLKIPTSNGALTMPKLLKQSERKVYVRVEEKNNYEDVLFRARMIPIVSGYMFAASTFCQRYCDSVQLKLVQLGTKHGENELFKKVEPEIGFKEHITRLLQKEGDKIFFCKLEPSHIPLVIVEDKDFILKQKIEQDGLDQRIGSAALGLAKLHTNQIKADVKRRVYVNMASPLIDKLIDKSLDHEKAAHLAGLLRSFMVAMCHDASSEELNFSEELYKFSQSLISIL